MKTLLLALFLLPSIASAQQPGELQEKKQKVVIIPIRDQIAPPQLYILRRGLKTAIEEGADTVILNMETPGGRLDVTFDMLKAIEKFPGKVVTYINTEAISAGALISAGTDEIWFAPTAIIGAAAPVTGGGTDIDETMKQKIVSYLKARVRAMSGDDENRAKAISAMIDADYELKFGDEVVKPKGELLSLTADEAMKEYGTPPQPLLAAGISPSITSLTDTLLGKGNYTTIELEVTWSEKLAQFITAIAPLLLAVGFVLVLIEFKTPGFGIFGISGAIILSVVFFGHYAAGLSGHEAALFFFIGFLLVAIDLFIIPGFFVLAVPGALLMIGSLLWGMSDIWPDQPIPWDSNFLFRPLVNLITGLGGAILIFALLLRFMPHGGLWGGMVLASAIGGETTASSTARREPSLIGATGHAVSGLFPSGEIEINGKRYDAHLAVGTATPGTAVKVISVGEFELKVETI
jgi:membrane-bound serine protease (ClpP class)